MTIDDITLGTSRTLQAKQNTDSGQWRKFTVDDGAIDHFIHAQNGTLQTALRELVMNAIDAGSAVCHIRVTSTHFSVQDQGHGFRDHDEIRLKFGHFAQNRDNTDSVYARFRIGRGQCMSLAKMRWRSNQFLLETDVKTHGNTYRVSDDLPAVSGCLTEGELYRPLSDWDLRQLQEELRKFFAFIQIELTLNGLPIGRTFPAHYWDVNTDRFCIKFDPKREDGIRLYNLGVYVKDLHYHRYGFSADVISKVPLTLNMARNELHETDTLYPEINAILKAKALEVAKEKQRKQKMDEVSRRNLIARFLADDIDFKEIREFTVLRDCRGHYLKIDTLWNNKIPLTIADEGFDRIADTLSVSRIAQVLHHDEARLWGVSSARELLTLIKSKLPHDRDHHYYHQSLGARRTDTFARLAKGIRATHTLIKRGSLSTAQRATLNALTYISGIMADRLNSVRSEGAHLVTVRKILPGDSDTAMAWTDGHAMIAVDQKLLTLPERGLWGAYQLCHILLHEYCHNAPNSDGHDHDTTFLQRFHDSALSPHGANEIMGHCLNSFIGRYRAQCKKYNLPIPNDLLTPESGRQNLIYHLYFEEQNTLSPFSAGILEAAGFVIEKRGACWRLRLNIEHCTEGKSRRGLEKYLNNLLAESKLKLLPDYDDPEAPPMHLRSAPGCSFMDQPIYKWMRKTGIERLEALCTARNLYDGYAKILSPEYKEPLYSFHHPMRFAESVLSLICADPSNNAIRFQMEYFPRRIRFGTAHALLDLSSSEARSAGLSRHYSKPHPEDPADVQRTVLEQIGNCINGIADPALRQDFIARFIPEELSLALGLKDDPPCSD